MKPDDAPPLNLSLFLVLSTCLTHPAAASPSCPGGGGQQTQMAPRVDQRNNQSEGQAGEESREWSVASRTEGWHL